MAPPAILYILLVSPLGSRTVRFPLASWSISMASNRDLKLPAPKPCGDSSVTEQGLVALRAHGQDQQEILKPTWWLCLWITSRKTVGLS